MLQAIFRNERAACRVSTQGTYDLPRARPDRVGALCHGRPGDDWKQSCTTTGNPFGLHLHVSSDGDTRSSEPSSVRMKGQRLMWLGLVALTGVVTVVAIVATLALDGRSSSDPWTSVLQDVVKVSYQGLVLGALAGLVKFAVDRHQAANQACEAHRSLQQSYTRSLILATHRVDSARTLLRTNRSVKTWSAQIDGGIIPASLEIRELQHELRTWNAAGHPAFSAWEEINGHLDELVSYLRVTIDEYAEAKLELSEKQLKAGSDKTPEEERRRLLDEIWIGISTLPFTGDLIRDGSEYGKFRERYGQALKLMRRSLDI